MLGEFVCQTLPGKVALKEEGNWTICVAMFNGTGSDSDEKDRSKNVARYTPTEDLPVKHVEDGESMRLVKACTAMQV